MRKCPYCAEAIQDDAKKCRFCGEWLTGKALNEVGAEITPHRASPTAEESDKKGNEPTQGSFPPISQELITSDRCQLILNSADPHLASMIAEANKKWDLRQLPLSSRLDLCPNCHAGELRNVRMVYEQGVTEGTFGALGGGGTLEGIASGNPSVGVMAGTTESISLLAKRFSPPTPISVAATVAVALVLFIPFMIIVAIIVAVLMAAMNVSGTVAIVVLGVSAIGYLGLAAGAVVGVTDSNRVVAKEGELRDLFIRNSFICLKCGMIFRRAEITPLSSGTASILVGVQGSEVSAATTPGTAAPSAALAKGTPVCPVCGLTRNRGRLRCDCGYDYVLKKVIRARASEA